jgi:hypothetical protein
MSTPRSNGIAVALFLAASLALLVAGSISPAFAGPVATYSRQSIDFSRVPRGQIGPVQAVFVTNTGGSPLSISATTIGGFNASDFSVAGTCNPPISLPSNGRCRLDFTMHGTGSGTLQAAFSLQSDSSSPPPAIDLRGLLDFGFQKWRLQRTADWIDFPATPIGGSATPQTIGVQNNEDFVAFDITDIGLVGGNSSDFTLTSTCLAGGKLLTGPGCAFTIGFQPTAPGPRSTVLRLSLAVGGIAGDFSFSVTGVAGAAGPPTVSVVEFHHAAFDHYFITPIPTEIALLDARAPPFQDWSRTGFSFNAFVNATAPAGSAAICRFFNDHFAPKSSHFYAAHGFGCEATIALFPDWLLEDGQLFNTMLPDAAGACPAGTIPVYRLYNNGMGNAPNHRFVTSLAERQKMIDQGFVAEGNGIGVGMCVPS